MPDEELHQLILEADRIAPSASAIRDLSERLPHDPGILNCILRQAVQAAYGHAFGTLALAILQAGRPVESEHLVEGFRLLPAFLEMVQLSRHSSGNVGQALVDAFDDGRLSWEREALALMLALKWSRERDERSLDAAIAKRTRMLARDNPPFETQMILFSIGEKLRDDHLDLVLSRFSISRLRDLARPVVRGLDELWEQPLRESLDTGYQAPGPPQTRRRAIRRIGRNELCHCGSGKKYKRCCEKKDRLALLDSSDVAGVTRSQLRQSLEDHLTEERIESSRAADLVRLDPRRIEPRLRWAVLEKLTTFEEFPAVASFIEATRDPSLQNILLEAVDRAFMTRRWKEAHSLLALIADSTTLDYCGFPARFWKEKFEDYRALDIIEEVSRERIDKGSIDLALDLLNSPWPCLGILAARGAAPLANPWDRETLFQELGKTRDRLGFHPVDPSEDIPEIWDQPDDLDSRFFDDLLLSRDPGGGRDPGPVPDVEKLKQELASKEQELIVSRDQLRGLRTQIELSDRVKSQDSVASASTKIEEPESPELRKLRQRVSRLKDDLKERHSERNQLRRQLHTSKERLNRLQTAQQDAARNTPEEAADEAPMEDFEPIEALAAQSFRIPVFGERFRSSLRVVPDSVRRKAVLVASRIGAADVSAFQGLRRLKLNRDIYRQRVGRDYRLLFRLHKDEVEILDLVTRQNLEQVIRHYS